MFTFGLLEQELIKPDYPGFSKFSNEGGSASKGNLIQYIENLVSSDQYEYFATPVSYGLTSTGQARINQSIEAFVYCILGSQVNVRSSIVGSSGSAKEVRREFLVLIEDAIGQPDISKYVQRFQLVIQEAKEKIDLAITPGTWLMPSRMIINTENTFGYNNKLKRAKSNIKLGVNLDINIQTKPVRIKHNLGTSKVELPHTDKPKRNLPSLTKALVRNLSNQSHRLRRPEKTLMDLAANMN